jgi:N-acylneuraminate cytidylyltransferase
VLIKSLELAIHIAPVGQEYDSVTQLMANCPLRNAMHIQQAMQHFENSNAPSQITCFRYGWMNPWWAVQLSDSGRPTRIFKDALDKRSQDLPSLFCPTGAIWIANSSDLINTGTFYCPKHIFWELPWMAAVDIDDEADLEMAHMLFQGSLNSLVAIEEN